MIQTEATDQDREDIGSTVRVSLDQLNKFAELDAWQEIWLNTLVADIPVLESALLAVSHRGSPLQPAAVWPRKGADVHELGDLIDACLPQKEPVLVPPETRDGVFGFAYPVLLDDAVCACIAGQMPLPDDDLESVEKIMEQVERNCQWIQSWYVRDAYRIQHETVQLQRTIIDSYVAVGKGDAFMESALYWVDSLSRDFQCDRVCLGVVKHDQVSLQVISGSSDFALNSVTSKQINAVMQEACDQRRNICWPQTPADTGIALQAEKLSVAQHNASVLAVPVYSDDELFLVLTFERSVQKAFTEFDAEQIEANVSLVSVAFKHRRLAEMSMWGVLRARTRRQVERLLAPGFVKRKIVFISLFFLTVFLVFARGEYRVNADAVLEPKQIRVVSAPFGGYLKSSIIRAGDQVSEGEVIAALEDSELRLEKIKAISRLSQANKQYSEALAGRDRAQAQIYSAQIEQSEAHLDSTESRLGRSVIKAPFDALVVSGDLTQRIGGSLSQGEELFRLSPMKDYRLILYVSEFKITDIAPGQKGRVVLSSMPSEGFDVVVEKVTPVTEVRDDGTVFRVEASLEQGHDLFRPGLVGIAKVVAGERLLIDIWTNDLRKWMSLKLWSFWG